MAAVVCAAVAALVEIRTVAVTWNDCDVGINASANAFGLIFLQLPVLWVVQALLVGFAAPLMAFLSRRRLIVTALMALTAFVLVVAVAWGYFALAGLPMQGSTCVNPEPGWWPRWLPPEPGYTY